ncbi:MAG: hypothetical protein RLZZ70_360 [Candidatus Parcubacteria bacterium]
MLGTLALLGLILALVSYAYVTIKAGSEWGGPTTISITGTGEAKATPDVASFTFSVRADGPDAATVQSKSAESVNSILAFLTEQGVDKKDVETSGYNLYPKFKYIDQPCAIGLYCPPGEQVPDGFEASQMVTVKVRDLAKAGSILSEVGAKGATDISGLTFTLDDDKNLRNEAREKAIADAKAQADILATQLGVTFGEIMSYYEESPSDPYYGGRMMEPKMMMDAEMAVSPEVPVGETTVSSRVNVTYRIK